VGAGEENRLIAWNRELAAAHQRLRAALSRLRRDHELIAALLRQLERGLGAAAPPGDVPRQLDGIAAIMESHFRYEERQLLGPLAALGLDADPRDLLGPA
jgi:hypothetical protein